MTAASAAAFSGVLPKTQSRQYSNPSSAPTAVAPCALRTSSPNLNLKLVRARRATVLCCSSTGPGGSSSGDSDSKNVLDAFFLGKALAEALNERIESTVGEFLSVVGRLQAEQQKQVQDFQEEVFERAKKAKERAARESMEGEGLVRKSTAASVTPVGGVASPNLSTSFSPSNSLPENDNPGTSAAEEPNGISEDPALGVSIE